MTSSPAPEEGRRERKKRETRQRISDVAVELFLRRGFEAVTIAEIADAADVSVNTVYNYFPSKEELFFFREAATVERPSRVVRDRAPGESAADALLGQLRIDVSVRSIEGGMVRGYEEFMRCIREAPSLLARVMLMQHRTAALLTSTLREETGAAEGDPLPELVAGQLVHVSNTVFRGATLDVAAGKPPEEVERTAHAKIDAYETLASEALLTYATRPTG